jgi:hypothetical protein
MRPYRRLLTRGGRMAAIALGSPGDLAYLLASRMIEAVYPLDKITAAHLSLEKSGGFGKRVVQIG